MTERMTCWGLYSTASLHSWAWGINYNLNAQQKWQIMTDGELCWSHSSERKARKVGSLGSPCVFQSMATVIGVSSAQLYPPVKYADLWLLLCCMPVLYPSHRHVPRGCDASLCGHWRGEQGATSDIEALAAGSCGRLVCGSTTMLF